MTIHGVVQDGAILPLEPLPADWMNGQEVVIEPTGESPVSAEERAEIEAWYEEFKALGPLEYEPGEQEAVEKFMAEADQQAKEQMRQSWARFNDAVPPGHESSRRGTEP